MLILIARLLAAATSPIPDCDEVFNFWEPTHFITHGSGLQTWEWSPLYAIRSWAYVGLHAALILPFKHLGVPDKYLFYLLRTLFALFEAWTEYKLYGALKKYSATAASSYAVLSAAATGLFHASVAYLPSTFGLYFVTWGAAIFLETPEKAVWYLSLMAIGGLLGWPFILLLTLPLGLYYTLTTISTPQVWLKAVGRTIACVATILALIVAVDSSVYQRVVVVPFNIVAYNVLFSSEDAGPEIFGVEPWTYYFVNLVLNFHALVPLALVMPLFETRGPLITLWSALVLWLATLSSTPHKEERFVYPVYALICLCGAVSLAKLWKLANTFSKLPAALYKLALAALCALSLLRTLALVNYYSAPLYVFDAVRPESTVCIGREWYRFPSSYFITGGTPEWIKSGFDGLLPGHFDSFAGIPEGMNNMNLYDPGKVVDIARCDYLMELDAPVNSAAGEVYPGSEWAKVSCHKFLDTERTPAISRILYTGYKVAYRDYCMYERTA